MAADRLGTAAIALALAALVGLAFLVAGGPPYLAGGMALVGGAGAAACGGVALFTTPKGARKPWLAYAGGLLGILAAVGFLAWAVGFL